MKILSNAMQEPKPYHHIFRLLPDRVIITLILAFGGLAIMDRMQAYQSLRFTFQSMVEISPFFLLAIFFAGYAKATGVDELIAKVFSGKPGVTILAASLAGAISPFCSCGVIPLIAAMLASGVPLAPVMAFCVSSPIMDPEMFILTAAGIHLNFAIAKTIAAINMGLIAGFTVYGLQKIGFLNQPLKRTIGCNCGQSAFNAEIKKEVAWRFWQYPERKDRFMEEIRKNGGFLGKWMVFAFFLESLMIAYIPAEWIAHLVGNDSWYSSLYERLCCNSPGCRAHENGDDSGRCVVICYCRCGFFYSRSTGSICFSSTAGIRFVYCSRIIRISSFWIYLSVNNRPIIVTLKGSFISHRERYDRTEHVQNKSKILATAYRYYGLVHLCFFLFGPSQFIHCYTGYSGEP